LGFTYSRRVPETGNSAKKKKSMLDRINNILSLNEKDKEHILLTIDALIRDAKTRKAYSH
jgi:hypothetical protein